jgi:hypothetical protein
MVIHRVRASSSQAAGLLVVDALGIKAVKVLRVLSPGVRASYTRRAPDRPRPRPATSVPDSSPKPRPASSHMGSSSINLRLASVFFDAVSPSVPPATSASASATRGIRRPANLCADSRRTGSPRSPSTARRSTPAAHRRKPVPHRLYRAPKPAIAPAPHLPVALSCLGNRDGRRDTLLLRASHPRHVPYHAPGRTDGDVIAALRGVRLPAAPQSRTVTSGNLNETGPRRRLGGARLHFLGEQTREPPPPISPSSPPPSSLDVIRQE